MNEKQLIKAVHNSMYQQWKKHGYATPVDTLMDCGVLAKEKYTDWRNVRIPYLEKVCTANLKKLSFIMYQMRVFAQKNNWKCSFCYYKQWGVKKKNGQGHKSVIPLRFSKSGNEDVEKWYSTHFVVAEKIKQLKKENKST